MSIYLARFFRYLPTILATLLIFPSAVAAAEENTSCSSAIKAGDCAPWKVHWLGWADNWNELAALGQFLGALVGVLTLFGLLGIAWQIRSEKIARKTQTSWTIYEVSIQVLNMLLDKPHLRPYLYDGSELTATPSNDSEMKIQNELYLMLEIMVDHWENIYFSKESLDSETIVVWEKYMRGIYNKSSELRGFLKPEREGYRYSEDFLDMISKDSATI